MTMEEKDTNIGQLIVNLYPGPGQTNEPPQLTYGAGYPYPHHHQQQQQPGHGGGGYPYYFPSAPPQQPYGDYGYGYPPHESAYYGGGGVCKVMECARNAVRRLYHRFSCRRRRHGHGYYGYGHAHAPRTASSRVMKHA